MLFSISFLLIYNIGAWLFLFFHCISLFFSQLLNLLLFLFLLGFQSLFSIFLKLFKFLTHFGSCFNLLLKLFNRFSILRILLVFLLNIYFFVYNWAFNCFVVFASISRIEIVFFVHSI